MSDDDIAAHREARHNRRRRGGRRAEGKTRTTREIEWAPDREIWDQQPDEPETAYTAFVAYRDAPLPRPTLADLSRQCAVDLAPATLRNYSGRWAWTKRAQAWDRRMSERVQTAIVQTHTQSAEVVAQRQLAHAAKLHDLAGRELDKMLHLSATTTEPTVTPKTLLTLITLALSLDRAMVPDNDAPGAKALDLTQLDVADLRSLRSMADKIASGEKA